MEYGLIGEKLGHSHSPRIHRLLAGYDYQLRELSPQELPAFLEAGDFRGLNVTIPYKQAVVPYCDALGEGARRIGCVNTLVRRPDGTLFGENTDYAGFRYTLARSGIRPAGRRCLVLGTGGTSLTVTRVLEDLGAASVDRVSRRGALNYETVYQRQDAEIIVNTTPVGMYPNNGGSPLDLSRFPGLRGAADVVYNPLKTAFRLQAEALGIPFAGGFPMLAAQARAAAELFTGRPIPGQRLEEVCREVAGEVTNIVLIGMPGSGKSAVGAALAAALGRELLDSDEEIVRRAGRPIPEIFSREGEARFRALESQVLADLGRRSGVVIATGGGAVLRGENLPLLRQNGRLCRLRRDVSLLPVEGRPISQSCGSLSELERQREPFYAAAADWTVDNNGPLEQTADQILKLFREQGGIL